MYDVLWSLQIAFSYFRVTIDPALEKPFASGNISSGILSLKVGLKEFANPVDIYIAISYSGLPGDIFFIDSSNGLHKIL